MTSNSKGFIKLNNITSFINTGSFIPKPSYYCSNNQPSIIITSPISIHQHNIQTNNTKTISLFTDGNNYIRFRDHAQCLDEKNEIIYIFGNNKYICLINLKTKEITFNKTNKLNQTQSYSSSVYIPSIHQIHCVDHYNHFIFDIDKNIVKIHKLPKMMKINLDPNLKIPKLVYVASIKKLMLLSGKIFCRDISCKNEWIQYIYTTNIPDRYTSKVYYTYNDVVPFTNIIIIFHSHGSIQCLDIINKSLYESNKRLPFEGSQGTVWDGTLYAVKGENNFIHLFHLKRGYHWKIHLHNIIPQELYKVYSDHYGKLIIGYIREQEHSHTIPTIPYVLKQLIRRYYPVFD